jgi:hypothetical protein
MRSIPFNFINQISLSSVSDKTKLGGLDLSRRGLDRDSRSRRRQRVSLDSRENLDSVKKLVSTIEISRSRSRYLDFVSTTMSRPKSLDRDREIRRDLKFSAFLDSLSRSRPRSAWIFVFSRRDFSIRRDFRPWQCRDFSTNLDRVSTNLDRVSTNLENLDVSRQISTISTRLDNLDKNLDASKSRLKNLDFKNLDREKKKVDLDRRENLDNLKKFVSTRRTFSISISICLDVETTNLNLIVLV